MALWRVDEDRETDTQVADRPEMIGQTGCHGRRTRDPTALRRGTGLTQAEVRMHEIVDAVDPKHGRNEGLQAFGEAQGTAVQAGIHQA